MSTTPVLFVGADPTGGTFAIEEELRLVETELGRWGSEAFRIVSDLDLRPSELQGLLNRHRPELLHFSGHVTEDGALMLLDPSDQGHVVPRELVTRIFAGEGRRVRCMVLNACNGDVLAPALSEAAEVIVAMSGVVTVRAAHAFSVRFYEALAGGRSVKEAFAQAMLEVELGGFQGELRARLFERAPGLADRMTFAEPDGPASTDDAPRAATPLTAPRPRRGDVFISYSHQDAPWMARLSTLLKPLERTADVEVWDDRRIAASDGWRQEIEEALARARIAILLVSPAFLASDFVQEKELPAILAARARGELDVLWCYLSPCLVDTTALAEIQAAHHPLEPLSTVSPGEQDRALFQVAARASEILRA